MDGSIDACGADLFRCKIGSENLLVVDQLSQVVVPVSCSVSACDLQTILMIVLSHVVVHVFVVVCLLVICRRS